jgi:hypothetical protein
MTDVIVSGPFFDGRTAAALPRICQEIQDQIAAQASADVHMWMERFFRNPTPYYETQVTTQRAGDTTVVHDRGVIYGPWLAGEGSRNQTTRFKGYAHWRLATQGAEARVPDLAAAVLRQHEEDLN